MNIPKPPKQKKISQDFRQKYLDEWKTIFKSLDTRIEVLLHDEDSFGEIVEKLHKNDIAYWNKLRSIRILIFLPMHDLLPEFLIGGTGGMYSSQDIEIDIMTCEEHNIEELDPRTKSWEEYYNEIFSLIEKSNKKEIPKPPTK